MKNIPYILFFALGSSICHAQTWLANDHQWTYNIFSSIYQEETFYNQKIGPDTTIQGQVCKEILFECDLIQLSKRYVYADNNKVFAWVPTSGSWIKIYDFDLSVGGILSIPTENPFGFPTNYKVILVDEVTVGSFTAKRQRWVLLDDNGNETNTRYDVVEGIGNVGLLDNTAPSCSRFFTHLTPFCARPVDGNDHLFACFSSNNGVFAPYSSGIDTINGGCLLSPSAVEPEPARSIQVTVQPNPAHGHLTVATAVNNPIQRVQLYQIQGVLQLETTPTNAVSVDLNTAHLAAGMYILLVQTAEGQHAQLVFFE